MRTRTLLTFLGLIIFSVIVPSCQPNKEAKKESFESIISKCLSKLKRNGPGSKYIVSPKFDNFEFNSFLRKDYLTKTDVDYSKKQTLDLLSWTNNDFLKIQDSINKKFSGKYYHNLLKLSNSEISNYVISFSGVHENLVFAEIICYCNAVKPSDLNYDFFNKEQRISSVGCVSFVIKNNNIEKIDGNGIVLEYQCKNSDIEIVNY